MAYPKPLERLVQAFERLPGVGRRTAERLAFHILRDPESRELADAIGEAVRDTRRCSVCCNVSEGDPCALCADPEREAGRVLVVEGPRDVEAVERTGAWGGRYHVLMGALNPADGTQERHLAVAELVRRIRAGGIEEVLLATDPDAEGEATALLVVESLDRAGIRVRVSRLARGLPAGSALEYLHRGVLEDAIQGRVMLRGEPRR